MQNGKMFNRNSKGSILILAMLGLVIIATTSIGILRLYHKHFLATKQQLKVNRCLGESAFKLKEVMGSTVRLNQIIYRVRLMIMACDIAMFIPPLTPFAKAGRDLLMNFNKAVAVIQSAWLMSLPAQLVITSVQHGCSVPIDLLSVKTHLKSRETDLNGPLPLEYEGGTPKEIMIYLIEKNYGTAAILKPLNKNAQFTFQTFQLSWASLPKQSRSIFD
jgi:hypothetical protein